jgi:DNA modification methylase
MRPLKVVQATVHLGDCLAVLSTVPDNSADSVVTDPPYAMHARPFDLKSFVGVADQCERCVKKPPVMGYVLCASCMETAEVQSLMDAPMLGMRSQNWHDKATHSRGYADNDNQAFQRWCEAWSGECNRVLKPGGHIIAFGGTRTWHRLAVAIEDSGFQMRDTLAWIYGSGYPKGLNVGSAVEKRLREAGLPEADVAAAVKKWTGWGTTLKPAHEPIVFARKALDGAAAVTVFEYGTGALNLGECALTSVVDGSEDERRVPSNVFLDRSQAEALDASAGSDVSRSFWVSKPSARERVLLNGVAHPTVKPLDLMRQLVRLVTPEDGTVLEPFPDQAQQWRRACSSDAMRSQSNVNLTTSTRSGTASTASGTP